MAILLSLIFLLLLQYYQSYSLFHPRYKLISSSYYIKSLHSSNVENNNQNIKTIPEEISDIVDYYIQRTKEAPIRSLSPVLLTENAHILTQSRYYEDVMQQKLSSCKDSKDVAIIEDLNSFLLGFVTSERRNRSRLKVNYILSAVVNEKLEHSIDLLSDSGEIDQHLMRYLDSLIEKEIKRSAGVIATIDDEAEITGIGKVTIKMLRAIQKRLRVEYEMNDKKEVKILAKLLREPNPEKRDDLMLTYFNRIEDLEEFEDFIKQGIEKILSLASDERDHREIGDINMDEHGNIINQACKASKVKPENKIEDVDKMSTEIYTKMKDILESLKQWKVYLKTGLLTDDVYSTSSDDYLSKSFNRKQATDVITADRITESDI